MMMMIENDKYSSRSGSRLSSVKSSVKLNKTWRETALLNMNSNSVHEEFVVSRITIPDVPISPPTDFQNSNYRPEKSDLLRSVECPICLSVPSPMTPLVNCQNGHFCCHQCRPRLSKCPLCSAKFTEMRNYPLEGILAAGAFDCDFVNDGCEMKNMSLSEYDNHVRCCQFNILSSYNEIFDCQTFSQENMNPPKPKDEIKCARCGSLNSIRKLKCHHCQTSLRAPTPICGRSPLRMVAENVMRMNKSRFHFR